MSSLSNLVQDQFHYNMDTFRPVKVVTFNAVVQTVRDLSHPGGGGSPWLTVFGGERWSAAGGVCEATCSSVGET